MSLQKERLHQKFREEYRKLNDQQRIAVDQIEGPVMVIAGPGTGKTQILAARIGKILLHADIAASNILCLTYTDAGAISMRKRLLEFIGPEAYRVHIHTFHAFCHDVIQENLSLFEKNSLDPISDLERIELFKTLIDNFPKNHPLKRYRSDVYYEIKNLQVLFSTMKREGWSPDFITGKIDDYVKDIPNRDEFIYKRWYKNYRPGDLKTDKIEEAKLKMEKLRAAVNEFDNYQRLMRQRNRYDFDDMINWVIKAFEEDKNLLANYQEQFQYILVDEYQDTSGTQNRLVELLINYWDKPNVFVVGDDDQSIYRFQGANVENMKAFADSYKNDLLQVVLTNNYRSTQPILDVSKTLIQNNNERLVNKMAGVTKELFSANTRINHLNHVPVIREYETERHEMVALTLEVEKLLAEGTEPGKIAIIYRENRYGEELAKFFRLRGIPVYSKRHVNILEVPITKKIILLLRYLAAEYDVAYGGDEMLFEILHFDWFNIPPVEIAKLSVEVAERQYSESKISLRQLLFEKSTKPPKDLFSQSIHEGLRNACKVLEMLIAEVSNVTLQTLFERIIQKAGVLSHIMQQPDKIWLLQVITGLFDFVKEETRRNPMLSLKELVQMTDLMESEKLSLPLVQVSGGEKGVNLLTAHGSKGMEFSYVFMAGCNSIWWEKKRKPWGGFTLPDNIFSTQSRSSDEEELRRLFYVGLTRAEKHLMISYCCAKVDGRPIEPTMFIAEIRDEHNIPVDRVSVSDQLMAEFQALQFGELISPEIQKIEQEFITGLLNRFVMNVTALNNYLNCPLEFYFKNLIRIPSPKNEATEFGSAVHYALEQLFRDMQNNVNQFGPKEKLIADFTWYMRRHRESFTAEQFARRMEYGLDVLSNYYDRYVNSWNKIVVIERNIRNVVIEDIPIKGKLDKLEFEGKSVNVVDYKTGDPEKARGKLSPPMGDEDFGGDYWRQAVFYKLLVDNLDHKGWTVKSTEFDFIEPDRKKRFRKEKVEVTARDTRIVTEQIKMVWHKIQNRDFYTGCGQPDCHWCNFVKTNNLAVALHDLQNEDEEE